MPHPRLPFFSLFSLRSTPLTAPACFMAPSRSLELKNERYVQLGRGEGLKKKKTYLNLQLLQSVDAAPL